MPAHLPFRLRPLPINPSPMRPHEIRLPISNATLATWFGVSAANLPVVLPNIGRFATPNLGFMG